MVKITLVGEELMSNLDITRKIYDIAAEENIHISMINLSETKISLIIKNSESEKFLNKIHKFLFLPFWR